MIMISSMAAVTSLAIILSLVNFVIISFVVAMVWLTLKEQKEAQAEEVQVVDVPAEAPVQEQTAKDETKGDTYVYIQVNNNETKTETPATEAAATETPAEEDKNEPSRLTFDEAYAALPKAQKSFFDGLLEYAKSKPDAKETRAKNHISVKCGSSLLVKLTIRRETAIASFNIENDTLKTYRRDAARTKGAKIKVKATEVPLVDLVAFDAAKGLVDVALEQIIEEHM